MSTQNDSSKGNNIFQSVLKEIQAKDEKDFEHYLQEHIHDELPERALAKMEEIKQQLLEHGRKQQAKQLDTTRKTLSDLVKKEVVTFSQGLYQLLSQAFLPSDDLAMADVRDGISESIWRTDELKALRQQTNWILADVRELKEGTALTLAQVNKNDPTPPRLTIVLDGHEVTPSRTTSLEEDGMYLVDLDQAIDLSKGIEVRLQEDGLWILKGTTK